MRRTPICLLVAMVAALGVACSTSTQHDAAPEPDHVSSHTSPTVGAVTKLLVFVVENHSLDQMQTQMPYTWELAQQYGYASNYFGVSYPSLPNYIAMTSGSTHGVADDNSPSAHALEGPSVFGEAISKGRTAAVYADGMPSNCAAVNGGDAYAVKHNPWPYYASERDECQAHDQPVASLDSAVTDGSLPNVGMVIPNMCHDAHDCPLRVADDWIRSELTMILAGPDWKSGHLAIVITADTDDRKSDNRVLTVVIHPSQHAHVVTQRLDHYSLSRLYSDVVNAPRLNEAASAPSMSDAFDLPISG
jgi:hypothetical protein